MLRPTTMKSKQTSYLARLAGGALLLGVVCVSGQATPRTSPGPAPARGAPATESAPLAASVLDRESDGERVFAWLGPFEPLLTPAQLAALRRGIHGRLPEMRRLEYRRRALALELLQTAVLTNRTPELVRDKATALGETVTELGLHQAELLGDLKPPLSEGQRAELRLTLARMFELGLEPLSFAGDGHFRAASPAQPDTPGLWIPIPHGGAQTAPAPPQPRPAPGTPPPRPPRR